MSALLGACPLGFDEVVDTDSGAMTCEAAYDAALHVHPEPEPDPSKPAAVRISMAQLQGWAASPRLSADFWVSNSIPPAGGLPLGLSSELRWPWATWQGLVGPRAQVIALTDARHLDILIGSAIGAGMSRSVWHPRVSLHITADISLKLPPLQWARNRGAATATQLFLSRPGVMHLGMPGWGIESVVSAQSIRGRWIFQVDGAGTIPFAALDEVPATGRVGYGAGVRLGSKIWSLESVHLVLGDRFGKTHQHSLTLGMRSGAGEGFYIAVVASTTTRVPTFALMIGGGP